MERLTELRNVMTGSVLMASACLAAVRDVNQRMEARSVRTTKMFNAWDMVDVLMTLCAVEAKSLLTNPVRHPGLEAARTAVVMSLETVSLLPLRISNSSWKCLPVHVYNG